MLQVRRAFTLIEIVVSLAIFAVITTVAVNTFITSYKTTQRATVENAILDDARYIMRRLTEEIKNNQIDYEEYFSREVVAENNYGKNFGLYAWQFYDGGTDPETGREDGIGTVCQSNDQTYYDYPNENCDTDIIPESEDTSTGTNPNSKRVNNTQSDLVRYTSSVCLPDRYYDFDASVAGLSNNCRKPTLADQYAQDELYLISADATQKTLIRRKTVDERTGQMAIALSRMDRAGEDGYLTTFACNADFKCKDVDGDGLSDPNPGSEELFASFIPISPLRTHIKELSFIISPLEDPRLAFAENFTTVRTQPQVTILLTVEPVSSLSNIFGENQVEIQLQTTVSVRGG